MNIDRKILARLVRNLDSECKAIILYTNTGASFDATGLIDVNFEVVTHAIFILNEDGQCTYLSFDVI